jgi:hypothetical protein
MDTILHWKLLTPLLYDFICSLLSELGENVSISGTGEFRLGTPVNIELIKIA